MCISCKTQLCNITVSVHFCAINSALSGKEKHPSKIKAFLVLKRRLTKTAYICVPTYQFLSFQLNSNEFSGA